jgi:flagellin-like hook-associated protein FlgL
MKAGKNATDNPVEDLVTAASNLTEAASQGVDAITAFTSAAATQGDTTLNDQLEIVNVFLCKVVGATSAVTNIMPRLEASNDPTVVAQAELIKVQMQIIDAALTSVARALADMGAMLAAMMTAA